MPRRLPPPPSVAELAPPEGPDFETLPADPGKTEGRTASDEPENGKPGDKAGADPATPADKSAGKSAVGRPFAKGHDPRQGTGPLPGAPNAGRPPSAVREAMRLAAAQRVPVLEAIADDPKAAAGDRIRAVDTLAKHGLGQMVEIGMDDVRGRLRETLVLLRDRLPADEFDALLPQLEAIWT